MVDEWRERIELKWGTLKGWDLYREKTLDIVSRYCEIGVSYSVMQQRDTPEQKQLICDLIDALDGDIINDWSGDAMTKSEAKKYVMGQR
jgi:hypothetical protein